MTPTGRTARQIRFAQLVFAGAAAAGLLALSGLGLLGQTAPATSAVASPGSFATDDNGNSVNDQGQTSGDIFTQNAQDQSTADGAGT
ncbi:MULTISPECIES: hypothetical protein [Mycobacterium]|uniref:Uncharacterized protein n=1 Tax=Mycobacterium kiyosense TaxID=2871094 RepID=A0A9P3Q316_9MYCO|nr:MULTISPECIES: hypothetical protein [Mycobacterium]BDB44912.1 hypothetical protein IWGMT90018_53580 [Mycobacterium kiyosense]BDE16400.1 hypothetical protein MKCMC460_52600 [Mycobacterium sp. 20KCMC460]GLB84665.1 hypothetical protein SRL2020028_39210 [Mycobacterium kiyosense]GLB89386.1 hypothetical protein SRL2020130_22030 [Mycobacterium kiyosense]GLB94884.1 hypothetical protein SRL2020226_16600 [Mycobacterium kiyosense]